MIVPQRISGSRESYHQTSKVIAYRLLTKASIEEKIRALQRTKSALVADVLGEEGFARSLSKADLEYLFAED